MVGFLLVVFSPLLIRNVPPLSWAGVALLVHIALVPTAMAYWLFFRGVAGLTAPTVAGLASPTAALVLLLEPITAAMFAAVIPHERLRAGGVVGGAMVLAGIGLVGRPPR